MLTVERKWNVIVQVSLEWLIILKTKRSYYYITWQAKYIANCLDEIKQELRQENATVKANAVAKLTYVSTLNSNSQFQNIQSCQPV